ncbi:STAS domain-containing protein [Alteromonas sp. LMIT006]|jgi:anti-anti-sigma factor|uniref:STAS domain-containing protein n=1 Tax=Alteromonadaceae TaxID=72275 RepID=UPI0020CA3387|nr:STAS domain-containing protein [Alteromonas sp. LMIT006]UTP71747.1 STAS domain-containing protein [Alteromonas sp. LMIT006]
MDFVKEQTHEQFRLVISGELDAESTEQIRPEFVQLSENPDFSTIIINLKNVSFIDSSGIGLIVFLFKKMREHSIEMILSDVHSQPLELIKLLRIDTVITVETYESESLDTLASWSIE